MRRREAGLKVHIGAALVCVVFGLTYALAGSGSHAADPPSLALPIDCDMATVCSVQNYVDVDAGTGSQDFRCGTLTYDGHQGTDFQLPDLATMRAGVVVRAAAAGTVRNIRDGVADRGFSFWQKTGLEINALGNAVAISHADGWETFYGHLRQGSVRVQPGDRVIAGQPIGLVGLSGKTQFPHLHFQLMRADKPVDPYTGKSASAAGCQIDQAPIWSPETLTQIAYRQAVLVCSGFALTAPDRKAIQDRCPSLAAAPADSEALVVFAEIAGVQAGDRLRFKIKMPDGQTLLDNVIDIDRPRARLFRYVGQKRPSAAWPVGRYSADVQLIRPDGTVEISLIDVRSTLEMR